VVRIVGAEVAMPPVEAAELAIRPSGFEDRTAGGLIAQFLRQPQIVLLANMAEFRAVFLIMFVELSLRAKAGSRRAKEQHGQPAEGEYSVDTSHQADEKSRVEFVTTFDIVVEKILAGRSVPEILPSLEKLASYDRQAVLCTVCRLQHEIATNCIQHGAEISALLAAQCPRYRNGVATCLIEIH